MHSNPGTLGASAADATGECPAPRDAWRLRCAARSAARRRTSIARRPRARDERSRRRRGSCLHSPTCRWSVSPSRGTRAGYWGPVSGSNLGCDGSAGEHRVLGLAWLDSGSPDAPVCWRRPTGPDLPALGLRARSTRRRSSAASGATGSPFRPEPGRGASRMRPRSSEISIERVYAGSMPPAGTCSRTGSSTRCDLLDGSTIV
jgi:hypothetical protein